MSAAAAVFPQDSYTPTERLEIFEQIAALAPAICSASNLLLQFIARFRTRRLELTRREVTTAAGISRNSLLKAEAELMSLNKLKVHCPPGCNLPVYELTLVPCANFVQPVVPCANFDTACGNLAEQEANELHNFWAACANFDTPPNEVTTTYESDSKERARVDIESSTLTDTIDREQNTPRSFDAENLAEAIETANPAKLDFQTHRDLSEMLMKHACRRKPEGVDRPDKVITSQIAAIISPPDLARLLQRDLAHVPAGNSYGWYLTVIAQRCHGVGSAELRKAREHWRMQHRRWAKPPAREESAAANSAFFADFQNQMRAAGQRRSLR
jgi:hypothetical protein